MLKRTSFYFQALQLFKEASMIDEWTAAMHTQALTVITQALVGVPVAKWHGFMQENFGTETTAQMAEISSNWAWESDKDEATVQAATAPDPEEGDAGEESEDLLVDEESSTAPPPKASTSSAPTAGPSKPAAAPPPQPSPSDIPDVTSLDFSSIQVPGTPAVEPAGSPAGSKQSVPRTPGSSKPRRPWMFKGYLCLVTLAGRLKSGLSPGSIFIPYCKLALDNTGIHKELVPIIKGVVDKVYRCLAPGCQVNTLDKPSITNHVRVVHTNSLLGCYYCQDPLYGVASAKAWKAHNDCLHPNIPHYWNEFEAVGQTGAIPPKVTITKNPSQVLVSPPSAPCCSQRRTQPTGAAAPPKGKAEDPILLSSQDEGEGQGDE